MIARRHSIAIAFCLGLGLLSPAAAVAADDAAPSGEAAPPMYTLGTGDQLRITVYGEEKLTGQYTVGSDGTVAMPLIGNVNANGQTVLQLQTAIAAALSHGFVRDPHVSVEMLNYRPFFILGEVNKPAQYPYVEQMTVMQAVATAGGYTYRANEHVAFIRHKGEAKEHRYEMSKGKAVWVMPGDTIRIGQRYF